MTGDRQCPRCGAANPSSAEWCNQCFERFDALQSPEPVVREAPPETDEATGTAASAEPTAGWVCQMCDTPNSLEATECRACGASIYRSFGHEPDQAPAVSPEGALVWALVPGVGHARAGQGVLGAALGLLIVITIVFGAFFASSAGTRFLGILLIAAGIGLWVLSALDAYRWANGEGAAVWLRPRVVTVLAAVIIGFTVLAFVVTGAQVGRQ